MHITWSLGPQHQKAKENLYQCSSPSISVRASLAKAPWISKQKLNCQAKTDSWAEKALYSID